MDEYENLRQHLKKVLEAIPFVFEPQENVGLDDVDDPSFQKALFCLEKCVERGESLVLGQINPKIPEIFSLGGLRRGEYVLFENEGDGTATVHFPYKQEIVEAGKGPLYHTMINVPINYVMPVLRKA